MAPVLARATASARRAGRYSESSATALRAASTPPSRRAAMVAIAADFGTCDTASSTIFLRPPNSAKALPLIGTSKTSAERAARYQRRAESGHCLTASSASSPRLRNEPRSSSAVSSMETWLSTLSSKAWQSAAYAATDARSKMSVLQMVFMAQMFRCTNEPRTALLVSRSPPASDDPAHWEPSECSHANSPGKRPSPSRSHAHRREWYAQSMQFLCRPAIDSSPNVRSHCVSMWYPEVSHQA